MISSQTKEIRKVGFQPQEGPQKLFLSCPADEILFGGARGGGKSWAALGLFWKHAELYGKNAKGILIRRTYTELSDIISKAKQMYQPVAVARDGGKIFTFYNGASIEFRYLERDADAERYQGKEYTMIIIEEAGNFSSSDPIDKMRATLRSPFPEIKKKFVLTANPGGPGNNWLKRMFVDPSPPMTIFPVTIKAANVESTITRVYIPAKISDNKILLESDPEYPGRVAAAVQNQPHLLRAWLDGDWDVVAGGMFDDIWDREIHVIKPFNLPRSWRVYRAFDWGSSSPFSVGWWAVTDGSLAFMSDGKQRTFPPKTMLLVDEWYGCQKDRDDKGLKLSESDFCEELHKRENIIKDKFKLEKIYPGPADTSIWDEDSFNKQSIADFHSKKGVKWVKADKSSGSRVAGWSVIRQMLAASRKLPMEDPGFFVFDTCKSFISIFPTLPRDEKKMEDLNTDTNDHCADMARYMARHRIGQTLVTRFSKGSYA